MNAIICCKCGGVAPYAEKAFKGMHPKEPLPTIYISNKAYTLLETLPKGSEAYKFLSGVLKKRGRYGYYMSWKEDGTLEEVYNYIKNQRVQ